MAINYIKVGGRLLSTAEPRDDESNFHIIAGADAIYDDNKGKKLSEINVEIDEALDDRYTKDETYSKNELNSLITTPNVKHVTVNTYAELPVTGSADTIYRVSNYNGSVPEVDSTKYSEYAWNSTQYVLLSVKSDVDEVFDISVFNAESGIPKPYETLSAALGNNGTNVPVDRRKGGMRIQFIQLTPAEYTVVKTEGVETQPTGTEVQEALSLESGTYTAAQMTGVTPPESGSVTYYLAVTVDETTTYTTWVITKATNDVLKYVQYRLMSDTFNTAKSDWQGVDIKPTAGSHNITESGGTCSEIRDMSLVLKDASSLIGNWDVDGAHLTFEATDGMNGTFTSHTAPSKPSSTRPCFIFQGFENGKRYRLRLKTVINASNANSISFFYSSARDTSWSSAKLIDTDGNVAICYSGDYLDCIFEAVSGKTYLGFSANALGIDDTVTISEFSICSVNDINDVDAELKQQTTIFNEKVTDAKTNLNKVGFIGKGSVYSYHSYKNILMAGHTYKFTVMTESWNMPEGVTSPTGYKFAIFVYNANGTERTRVADVKASDTVERNYSYTVPVNVNGLYFSVGGRIDNDVEVGIVFEDVTSVTALNTALNTTNNNISNLTKEVNTTKFFGWPKVFTKADANYKARLTSDGEESATGTNYKYIFAVNDYIRLTAGIDQSKYKILTAIHDTLAGARANSSITRHPFGRGMSTSATDPSIVSSYRFGNSTVNKGYLMVAIYKVDSSAITDEEVTEIESLLWLEFVPLNSTDKLQVVEKYTRLLDSKSLSDEDCYYFVSDSNGSCVDNPTRVKFINENIDANKQITIRIDDSLFSSMPDLKWRAGMFSDLEGAMRNTSTKLIESFVNSWQTSANSHEVTVVNTKSGVFSLYFVNGSNVEFSYNDLLLLKDSVKISIINNDIYSEDEYDELPLGQFVNKEGTGEILSDSTTIVSTPYITCVPYLGVTYKLVLPTGIQVRFVMGNSQSLGNTSYWYENDDFYTISTLFIVYRIQFRKKDGSTLTTSEISDAYANKLIKILYPKVDGDIKERNYDSEKYVKAAMWRLGWAAGEAKEKAAVHCMPTFVHVSDLHGDFKRFENAVEYAKMLNADAILASGDHVLCYTQDENSFMKDILDKHPGIPMATCIGNHETTPRNSGLDNSHLFNHHISMYVEQGNYKADANTAATMPYYYIDLDSANIRVITLNQYDNACNYGAGLGGRLGQTQITWFLNTLISTPAGYGVIIVMHANEDKIDTPSAMSAWNQTVNWNGGDEDTSGYCVDGLYVNSMRPIKTIVDAFIEKTAINTTYNENTVNGNNGETVTISADFSNVAEGVEFICYVTGHRHMDNIGYLHTATNKQLMLNIVCTNPHYPKVTNLGFSESCDIPRGDRGATQDAFNVYAIDRQNGRVKIARVGSSVNFEGIERKFLLAPYKYARYKVSKSLTNVTSSNTDAYVFSTTENAPCSYSTVFVAKTGYNLPSTITVMMGSTILTAGTDYTYDSTTGALSIPSVTDVLTITVAGTSV